jgi:hypothetical protein
MDPNFQYSHWFWQCQHPTQPRPTFQQHVVPSPPFHFPFIVHAPLLGFQDNSPVYQAMVQQLHQAVAWHMTAAPHHHILHESSWMIPRDHPSGIHACMGAGIDNSGTGDAAPPSANHPIVDLDLSDCPITRDRVHPSTYEVSITSLVDSQFILYLY